MRARHFTVALCLALAAAACGSDDGGTDQSASSSTTASDAVAASTTTPDEFSLVGAGDYAVGVTTITVTDVERDRPLTVDVWFPLASAGDADPYRYTLLPDVYYESPRAVGASPDEIAADGPFPLVAYSHGSGGLRYIASYYTEAIASHGYVVVAPDHTGNTAVDRITGTETDFATTAIDRPLDISAVLDAMTDPGDPEAGVFATAVDPERIAVTGHSFGGYTTYAMASGVTASDGAVVADARVDAIIPLAPATSPALLSDEDLAAISIPTLVMVGTNDQTTPADPNVTRPWALSPAELHFRVDLVDAQHQSFTDVCDYVAFLPTLDVEVPAAVLGAIESQSGEGCGATDMAIDRAKTLTISFAVQFLDSVFRAGTMPAADADGLPDDIVYEVK